MRNYFGIAPVATENWQTTQTKVWNHKQQPSDQVRYHRQWEEEPQMKFGPYGVDDLNILTSGAATLPHSIGLVGIVKRFTDARANSPVLLSLNLEPDIHPAANELIANGTLNALLRNREPSTLINIVTLATSSLREAEAALERIWPAHEATALQIGLTKVARGMLHNALLDERQKILAQEIDLSLAFMKVNNQIADWESRHPRPKAKVTKPMGKPQRPAAPLVNFPPRKPRRTDTY